MFNFKDLESAVKIISSSLESEDRRKRKRVVEDLQKELSSYDAEDPRLAAAFDAVRMSVWSSLNDTAETVRDSSIDLVTGIIDKIPCNNQYLDEVLPIILHRLDDSETREPSEELRLKLVQFLTLLTSKYSIEVYAEPIITTLAVTLTDKYAKVRQESAKCCVALAPIGGQALYDSACKLVKPILSSFKHNHSRTRICALEALCFVLKEANWKHIDAQLVFGSLGERIFDDNPGVRMALVNILGSWLVDLRDRYSFFNRLVPLILSCLTDDQPEVAEKARVVWSAAGRQYLSENEQDLKDRIDFLDEKPQHYPPGIERPNLGCRTLVQRNMCQITTPLTQELTDWQPDVCVQASALLTQLVLHAEADLTQHVANVLNAMYRVAGNKGDIPQKSRQNVEKAAEYLGYFIAPSTWHGIILPTVESEPSPGNLFVLAAVLRGSSQGSLDPYADGLAQLLASSDICTSMKPEMQLETLKCCGALLENVNDLSKSAISDLLICLCYVTSATFFNPATSSLALAGQCCQEKLATKTSSGVDDLLGSHVGILLAKAVGSVDAWCILHCDFWLFLFIISKPGLLWLSAKDIVHETFCAALQLDRGDVEVKSHLFAALATIFEELTASQDLQDEAVQKFAEVAVKDLIIPNLTWRAGLSAEKLRTLVLVSLVTICRSHRHLKTLPCRELMPPIVGAVKDNPPANRKFALEGISHVIEISAQQGVFDAAFVEDVYSTGRLDDIEDEVRFSAVETLSTLFRRMLAISYGEVAHSAVISHVVSTMVVYLDDDNVKFQQAVYDDLAILTPLAAKTISEKIVEKKHLFKSQDFCNQLIELSQPGDQTALS